MSTSSRQDASAESSPEKLLDECMTTLGHSDPVFRQYARLTLQSIGRPAVPRLLAALDDPRQHVRWEAAKTLAGIADPAAAEKLVAALGDEDFDVRQVAGDALVAMGTDALEPLLAGLACKRDEFGVYDTVRHVVRHFAETYPHPLLDRVVAAFDHPEPEIAVPVEAGTALVKLRAASSAAER